MMTPPRLSSLALIAAMMFVLPAEAADIGAATWSELDASNSATPPAGFPAGMNPAQVHPAARAMMGAIKRWYDRIQPVKTSAGTANVQTLTYDAAGAAYVTGEIYRFIVGAALTNTGAATLNINGIGALAVQSDGAALIGGELVAGRLAEVYYDGAQFQLLRSRLVKGTQSTKTSNYQLLTADSGSYFDNTGAVAEVDFTLPAYAAGLRYCFTVTAAQILKVIAPASNKISVGTINSSAAGTVYTNTVYSDICIFATKVSNQWAADSITSGWSVH